MTKQWKSGTGNCAFDRIVKGTAYPAMAMLKLPVCETAGRIERECDVAPKGLGGEAECVVVMDSLMLNNWKEIYITDDLYKYLKEGM